MSNEQYKSYIDIDKEYVNTIEKLRNNDDRVIKIDFKEFTNISVHRDDNDKVNQIIETIKSKNGNKWIVAITYDRYKYKHKFDYGLDSEVKIDKVGDKYFEIQELNPNVKIIYGLDGYFYRTWEASYNLDEEKL